MIGLLMVAVIFAAAGGVPLPIVGAFGLLALFLLWRETSA